MLCHILSHSVLRGMQEEEVESRSTLSPQCHCLPKHALLQVKFRVALRMFELVPDSSWQPAPCQYFAE